MNGRGPSNSLSINETSIPRLICSRSPNSVFFVFSMFFRTKKKKDSCFIKLFLRIVFKNTKNTILTIFLLYEFSVFCVFQNKKLNK